MCHHVDRFWYDTKNIHPNDNLYWALVEQRAQLRLEYEKKRPNSVNMGTKPDKIIRW